MTLEFLGMFAENKGIAANPKDCEVCVNQRNQAYILFHRGYVVKVSSNVTDLASGGGFDVNRVG
jgi:hypothetical protein